MKDGQIERLRAEEAKCQAKILQSLKEIKSNETSKCPMVWDDIMCWDSAPPGTMQRQRCPEYVQMMNHSAYAYRFCEPEGKWYHHEAYNKTWTNYIGCIRGNSTLPPDAMMHKENIGLVQTIGYGVSLVSLVIAVLIMCFSRLKSKSNTLHVNLFLAFIVRAGVSFTKQVLFVEHVGLEKDVLRKADGSIEFIDEGLHWECRLIFTVFMYSICVSQMWIFVEGLYLHMLIYRTLSTERNGVRPYIILGWVSPFAILVPWVVVKATQDNIVCWNVNTYQGLYWVFNGPLLATVLLNFIFFLNICRVLCLRARSSSRHAGQAKYRQLAKFILVLIPLFGVVFVIFAVVFPSAYLNKFDFWPMFLEQIYNAFQGFILALLFCFLNEEVHNEMKRIWWRRRTRRRDSALTRSFMLSSFRRGNSYTPRATSNKSIHPLRTTSCRDSTPNASNPGKEQITWTVRLKRRVLRLFGKSSCDDDSLVKSSPGTSPFMIRDNGLASLSRIEQEEVEMRMNLTGPNHHSHDLEDISG